MKSNNIKITSTIVLALLLASLTAHVVAFGGIGSSGRQYQPAISPQAVTPLNLAVKLSADGATFPALLIQNYITGYQGLHPNVTITYSGGGSGQGQRDFINKTMDFAASDAPLNAGQRILAPNALHIPETIGSVTAAYNLPGNATGVLNLDGPTLANIYLHNIINWNDSAIRALNPGLKLPNQTIKVAYRTESSGTSFVWTSYLSDVNNQWRTTPGLGPSTAGPTYPWPTGVGSIGNGGVAKYVNTTAYALGYVELAYIITNHMTVANVKNPAGNFIFPSEQSTASAVADSAGNLPPGNGDWSAVSLLLAPGANDYPIASFSYFLVYKELNVIPSMDLVDNIQAQTLKDFLNYAVTTGQGFGSNLGFVPLPAVVVANSQASINSITFTHVSTPVTRTVSLSASGTAWSLTSLTVTTGDTINFNLLSTDGLPHKFYIDFNNNGVLDPNEDNNCASPVFSSSTTPTPWAFKPVIWSQEGIPAAGTYTFRDANNAAALGTIIVQPQQTAAVLLPHSSLTSSLAPVLDSSRVTVIGSGIIDQRTRLLSGNLTEVAVDKAATSFTSATFIKSYIIPSITMSTTGTTSTVSFGLNAAVAPFALSTTIQIQLNGLTGSSLSGLTRELDAAGRGVVDIVDLSGFAFHFDSVLGQPNYDPRYDENADGRIDIIDISTAALFFDDLAFS
ncbi:MAG TPA: phosphate ABC transporter substrate-binding protein PstS [Candidatus Bathyarchaeia archaeon]|nr:phosphate ABC transporter substrate-binding protein PstS [Candidatus Bathyarchaeia archaeon]